MIIKWNYKLMLKIILNNNKKNKKKHYFQDCQFLMKLLKK